MTRGTDANLQQPITKELPDFWQPLTLEQHQNESAVRMLLHVHFELQNEGPAFTK